MRTIPEAEVKVKQYFLFFLSAKHYLYFRHGTQIRGKWQRARAATTSTFSGDGRSLWSWKNHSQNEIHVFKTRNWRWEPKQSKLYPAERIHSLWKRKHTDLKPTYDYAAVLLHSVDKKKISSQRLLVDYKDESQGVVIMLEGEESKLQFKETNSEDWVRFCSLLNVFPLYCQA